VSQAISGNRLVCLDLSCTDVDIFTRPIEIPITNAVVGASTDIMYSAGNNRLLFLKRYGEFCIMPLLQRNTIMLANTIKPADMLVSR